MSVNKREKVAIVGFAPSWKETPFDSQDTEIWCLNEMYRVAPEVKNFRADRWFEIHDLFSKSKAVKEHQEFLQKAQHDMPLYVQKKYDHLPNAIVFPFNEIIEFFEKKGVCGKRYFTNSISWFIAYAIMLEFKEIAICGVDMATDSEYGWQRPSCEYWIAAAEFSGIKVTIPESSDLLKCGQLYAIESSNKNRNWMKAQVGELNKRIQHYSQQEMVAKQNELQCQIAQAEIRGAKSAYQEILKRTQ
jgi:hypothetical protein